jgi:hypothetical protein
MPNESWGPLANLIGEWEGAEGLDVSFHNATGRVGETRYRERATFEPFGPVDNGNQHLWGLDYRMMAFRIGEDSAFHTEVGYWLWDADAKLVLRCFMVPRGVTVLAGGKCASSDKTFALDASCGEEIFGILSNPYLASKARTSKYTCKVATNGDTFSYDQCTTYHHGIGGEIAHTDRNTLKRVR